MHLSGLRVLLTGASGGIGHALAQRLVEAQAFVLLQGRSGSRLQELALELGADRCAWVEGDLTNGEDLAEITAKAIELSINVLINNAGITEFKLFDDANIEGVISTNVIGTMRLTQSLLPHLRQLNRGMIVNVGSTFGAIGYPGYVVYSASKHAIRGFSEGLRRELSGSQIQVLYVSPRATATKMNSDAANQANLALGVTSDSADAVARRILLSISKLQSRHQIGVTERFQIFMNAMFPRVVDGAIARQLRIIKQFAD